jgi:anti-sigma-K factor RskA
VVSECAYAAALDSVGYLSLSLPDPSLCHPSLCSVASRQAPLTWTQSSSEQSRPSRKFLDGPRPGTCSPHGPGEQREMTVVASPNNWRMAIVNMAIGALVVAIALHIAADLIRSVAPELIAVLVLIASGYGLWALARIRRSRW